MLQATQQATMAGRDVDKATGAVKDAAYKVGDAAQSNFEAAKGKASDYTGAGQDKAHDLLGQTQVRAAALLAGLIVAVLQLMRCPEHHALRPHKVL